MRRWVIVCLMWLLPVQWAGAATVESCTHGPQATWLQFGDTQDAGASQLPPGADTRVSPNLDDGDDCDLSEMPWLPAAYQVGLPQVAVPPRFSYLAPCRSHIPGVPERPERPFSL